MVLKNSEVWNYTSSCRGGESDERELVMTQTWQKQIPSDYFPMSLCGWMGAGGGRKSLRRKRSMLRVSLIRLFGAGKGMMISNSGHTKCYQ